MDVEMTRATQHLPDDLLRLPPLSLAVCKDWRSLVSDPTFRHAHAERPADVAEVTVNDGAGTGLQDWFREVVLFDWFRGDAHNRSPCPVSLTLPLPSAPETMVLGSWDGVLCVERGAPPLWSLRWRLFNWTDAAKPGPALYMDDDKLHDPPDWAAPRRLKECARRS
ncbi:hypothetical protein E2562_012313 [Oryza meyeriana var. granulata]|uniref:F-box domain-containing protein n=1 Tax=Oryza meyeriana var. granulata TaxID=110450 RepID=A0A6G1DG81_9ORYZ|nr:hypothetical protein E2562_012313 [Oryza meyeriana var. granulata]